MKHQTEKQGQTTTPRTPYEKCAGFFNVPCQFREDVGDEAYGLSSLSEKTTTSNHLQMELQRQHIILTYFKKLLVRSAWA